MLFQRSLRRVPHLHGGVHQRPRVLMSRLRRSPLLDLCVPDQEVSPLPAGVQRLEEAGPEQGRGEDPHGQLKSK